MRVNQKLYNIKYQHWSTDNIIQNNKKVYKMFIKAYNIIYFSFPTPYQYLK